jgi:hypothetical protein
MLQKSVSLPFFLTASLLLSSYTVSNKQKALRTVIIDAGHGIMSNGGGYNGAQGTIRMKMKLPCRSAKAGGTACERIAGSTHCSKHGRKKHRRPARSRTDR